MPHDGAANDAYDVDACDVVERKIKQRKRLMNHLFSSARSSSGGVAICYVLPVLRVSSCLHIMTRNKRLEKVYTKATRHGAEAV